VPIGDLRSSSGNPTADKTPSIGGAITVCVADRSMRGAVFATERNFSGTVRGSSVYLSTTLRAELDKSSTEFQLHS